MPRLLSTILWRRLDVAGTEHFRLWEGADFWRLEGSIHVMDERVPLAIDYLIECDAGWTTRSATVTLLRGQRTRKMELTVNGGRWTRDAKAVGAVEGCIDVDLSITPSTNLLPIRRLELLSLSPGSAREVMAAWVLFPSMEIRPLRQRYTALGGRRFRYESWNDGTEPSFNTEIEVDERGLSVSYPPLWARG